MTQQVARQKQVPLKDKGDGGSLGWGLQLKRANADWPDAPEKRARKCGAPAHIRSKATAGSRNWGIWKRDASTGKDHTLRSENKKKQGSEGRNRLHLIVSHRANHQRKFRKVPLVFQEIPLSKKNEVIDIARPKWRESLKRADREETGKVKPSFPQEEKSQNNTTSRWKYRKKNAEWED